MRPLESLTPRGQGRRLRVLALEALRRYDVPVRRIGLVANHLNGIFRVDAENGERFALRISHPTWRTDQELSSELAWLQALAADTGICVPAPVANRDGELVTLASAGGVPEPRRCVLQTWLPGPLLAERLDQPHVSALGALSARLHAHGLRWTPPPGFTTRRLDGIYVRGEPDALFSDAAREHFSGDDRETFLRVAQRVQGEIARLYADPAGLRVVHDDLHHENVKVWRGRLCPFDFEDVIWGYPVQDIAMTFFDLLDYGAPRRTDYDTLRLAFQRGYTTILPWPETHPGQIDTFIAGRQVWRANWVVRFEAKHAPRFLKWMASRCRAFLETGAFPR